MDKLYIETENGNQPIDNDITQKYNLQKGTKSPFTGNRIVDKYGDCIRCFLSGFSSFILSAISIILILSLSFFSKIRF